MIFFKKSFLLLVSSLTIAIILFLKNAWVTEDAYILFRSIEQLFAGNGPVWNPHNRVQVYTSPLWYLILSCVRFLSSNAYLNVIFTSLLLWLSTVLVLRGIFKNPVILLVSILCLSASTAFFDYTSSGLENGLAYLIITLYVYCYLQCFKLSTDNSNPVKQVAFYCKSILFLYGLIICVRHDLGLLLLPPTLFTLVTNHKIFSIKEWALYGAVAFLPFFIYSLFSLIYYGLPLPNTAYAKLYTGISSRVLLEQGLKYFYSSLKYDTITLVVIGGTLALNFFKRAGKHIHFLGFGIVLNLIYICYVGGDFMQGRFFSYAYLITTILLMLRFAEIQSLQYKNLSIFVLCGYLIFYPHTPLNSPLDYKNFLISEGIADERGFYAKILSLYRYVGRDKNTVFPDHPWAEKGVEFKESPNQITVMEQIGVYGYYAGVDKIILDPLALSEPLLARIPVPAEWRIGHFRRHFPEGYVESIRTNKAVIVNPQLNEYYKKLKILTQNKDLFSQERLKTIVLFNLGYYDYLLDK